MCVLSMLRLRPNLIPPLQEDTRVKASVEEGLEVHRVCASGLVTTLCCRLLGLTMLGSYKHTQISRCNQAPPLLAVLGRFSMGAMVSRLLLHFVVRVWCGVGALGLSFDERVMTDVLVPAVRYLHLIPIQIVAVLLITNKH